MTEPERIHADPSVAIVAYRFPAESPGPQSHHDVALMLGEEQDCPSGLWMTGQHEARRAGTRVVCGLCRAVLRWWQCDCADSTFREKPCKHIQEAIRLYAAERRGERASDTE